MHITDLPKDILYYIRLYLPIPDLDKFNLALNQFYAPIPKPLVDDWFNYQFNKGWKHKLALAGHPSIKLVSKSLLQDRVFNFGKFTSFTFTPYSIKRVIAEDLVDFVQLYIDKKIVDPSKKFNVQDFECLNCQSFFTCWLCQDPLKQSQYPIVMASNYSWDLVDLLMGLVDPYVDNNIVLTRAILSRNHYIVKRLVGKKVDVSFYDKTVQIRIKAYVFNVTLLQLIKFFGWKDILELIK